GFEERDHVADLIAFEPEFRYVLMPGADALGERFLQTLDRVLQMQRAEWRRNPQRAFAHRVDRVTARAVRAYEIQPALHSRLLRGGVRREESRERQGGGSESRRVHGLRSQLLRLWASRRSARSASRASSVSTFGQ